VKRRSGRAPEPRVEVAVAVLGRSTRAMAWSARTRRRAAWSSSMPRPSSSRPPPATCRRRSRRMYSPGAPRRHRGRLRGEVFQRSRSLQAYETGREAHDPVGRLATTPEPAGYWSPLVGATSARRSELSSSGPRAAASACQGSPFPNNYLPMPAMTREQNALQRHVKDEAGQGRDHDAGIQDPQWMLPSVRSAGS